MMSPELHALVTPNVQARIVSAPGRLDVMGGIADYSGSLVLQLPLDRRTTAVLQARPDDVVEIISLRGGEPCRLEVTLGDFFHGALDTPGKIASAYATHERDRWGAYVLGVVHACLVRRPATRGNPTKGFRLIIESNVPEGKGISSSAALEVACFGVISAHYGIITSAEDIAVACQWAENHIAGAPCGIMDQMTSACGRRDHLLRLRCQPATIEGHVAIPDGYRFYGIDSGIRHAVTGADYSTVRTAAFMGYRIVADLSGFPVEIAGNRAHVVDDQWYGYLANITPAHFQQHFADQLPVTMLGAEFIDRYAGITDEVTHVRPDVTYPVRQATAHPVYENARVERFADLLEALDDIPANAMEMGRLMFESHASYGACGLGSTGTDRLVELVRAVGPDNGLFGAKITGGGSGGTVAVFGTEGSERIVRAIAERYAKETGNAAEVFAESGEGMAERGVAVSHELVIEKKPEIA
ncbi:MAG: galactokinase family protein [bacterium]